MHYAYMEYYQCIMILSESEDERMTVLKKKKKQRKKICVRAYWNIGAYELLRVCGIMTGASIID